MRSIHINQEKNKRRRTLGYDNRKQEWELLPEVERNGSRKRRPS
jgi:hypothetical protein